MSTNVRCYLRTLRRQSGLTQRELASLLPKAGRNRVSRIERGLLPPNAAETVACALIFGSPAAAVFPHWHEEVSREVARAATHFRRQIGVDNSPLARCKRELLDQLLVRARTKRKASSI